MAKSKPIGPVWWSVAIMTAIGIAVGHRVGAELGWGAFGLSGVSCWVIDSFHRPLSDCWFCKGKAKRRGRGGEGSTFHRCIWPKKLGGCGGRGERRRLLTAVTG